MTLGQHREGAIENPRRRRKYDEDRRRWQRLEKAGFVFGTVRQLIQISDEEHGKIEDWVSLGRIAPDRALVWREAARLAVEHLPQPVRLSVAKLLRVCQQGVFFKARRRDLERSGIFVYSWERTDPSEEFGPASLIGFETPDAFWLLDVGDKIDQESIRRWQAERARSYNLGRGYARLRELAGKLAADLDHLFAQPYKPSRLPPLSPTKTPRANREPFKLHYSTSLRMSLRPGVLQAWKNVSGKASDVRRAVRCCIVDWYMRDSYGIEDASQTLQLERMRVTLRASRAAAATALIGATVQVRALTTVSCNRRNYRSGALFEYPALVFFDEIWAKASSYGRGFLPVVAVGGTRKGDAALLYADLLLYVGGYRRQLSDGKTAHRLETVAHREPVDAGTLISTFFGRTDGSTYARGRKMLGDLEALHLLRSERVGKRCIYMLGDGPHTSLRGPSDRAKGKPARK